MLKLFVGLLLGVCLTIMTILISSCRSNVEYYKEQKPKVDLKNYLNGHIKGTGLIQNWRGNVTERFTFNAQASWKGDIGTLDEHMVYANGRKDHRIWTIKKITDSHYIGTTPEVVGEADIRLSGNAMNWTYTMDVKVDGSTYRLNFDDWMFLTNDGALININKFKKFGITVGSLTLFMHKVDK